MASTLPPLIISNFRTGLYTHRSQLFAPFRSLGINISTFHDALIDGQDMEVTDLLEIQRRPGFSRFCSQQLAASEIPNQFYSFRAPTGTVLPLMDTNQRFTSFSSSAITSLWTKPSADQAFPMLIGSQLYIANGTANGAKRYDTGAATLHSMGIAAPTAMPTITPTTTAGTTFWQPNIVYGAVKVCLFDTNGNIQYNFGNAVTTGTQPPVWNTVFFGVTADGAGTWTNIGPPGFWAATTSYANATVISDSNGNFQLQIATTGNSGATQPVWATTLGSNTTDGAITWQMIGIAKPQVYTGYTYCYVYSTQVPTITTGYYHCSTASPLSYTTGVVFGSSYSYPIKGAFSTNPDCGSVDIYRTKDGGSLLEYAGSVVNNVSGGTWTFTDNILDSALSTTLIVPLPGSHVNDPPPGSTGSVAPTTDNIGHLCYWQGRLWACAGNKVYFDAGANCINGDPHASWPPANVFSFPGPTICTQPTSIGLLVFLADSVKIILGGPDTSSFYSNDLLQNFGISSANCISHDGDTLRVLTTQGQQFTLNPASEKAEDGFLIADLIGSTFPAASSYITMHRNGLDSGVFLSNGTDTVVRYGSNIGAWSPLYKPVGGIKAMKSIETSVGTYTLCAGRASAQGYILGRDLTVFQDDGLNYSNCFATVGNIVLAGPGAPNVPVVNIAGYFAATGSIPTISYLPNEISATSGATFITIPGISDEPPLGASPSKTLMAKRWSLNTQQTSRTSLLMHHLQIKVSFPAENKANTIKMLSIMFKDDA